MMDDYDEGYEQGSCDMLLVKQKEIQRLKKIIGSYSLLKHKNDKLIAALKRIRDMNLYEPLTAAAIAKQALEQE